MGSSDNSTSTLEEARLTLDRVGDVSFRSNSSSTLEEARLTLDRVGDVSFRPYVSDAFVHLLAVCSKATRRNILMGDIMHTDVLEIVLALMRPLGETRLRYKSLPQPARQVLAKASPIWPMVLLTHTDDEIYAEEFRRKLRFVERVLLQYAKKNLHANRWESSVDDDEWSSGVRRSLVTARERVASSEKDGHSSVSSSRKAGDQSDRSMSDAYAGDVSSSCSRSASCSRRAEDETPLDGGDGVSPSVTMPVAITAKHGHSLSEEDVEVKRTLGSVSEDLGSASEEDSDVKRTDLGSASAEDSASGSNEVKPVVEDSTGDKSHLSSPGRVSNEGESTSEDPSEESKSSRSSRSSSSCADSRADSLYHDPQYSFESGDEHIGHCNTWLATVKRDKVPHDEDWMYECHPYTSPANFRVRESIESYYMSSASAISYSSGYKTGETSFYIRKQRKNLPIPNPQQYFRERDKKLLKTLLETAHPESKFFRVTRHNLRELNAMNAKQLLCFSGPLKVKMVNAVTDMEPLSCRLNVEYCPTSFTHQDDLPGCYWGTAPVKYPTAHHFVIPPISPLRFPKFQRHGRPARSPSFEKVHGCLHMSKDLPSVGATKLVGGLESATPAVELHTLLFNAIVDAAYQDLKVCTSFNAMTAQERRDARRSAKGPLFATQFGALSCFSVPSLTDPFPHLKQHVEDFQPEATVSEDPMVTWKRVVQALSIEKIHNEDANAFSEKGFQELRDFVFLTGGHLIPSQCLQLIEEELYRHLMAAKYRRKRRRRGFRAPNPRRRSESDSNLTHITHIETSTDNYPSSARPSSRMLSDSQSRSDGSHQICIPPPPSVMPSGTTFLNILIDCSQEQAVESRQLRKVKGKAKPKARARFCNDASMCVGERKEKTERRAQGLKSEDSPKRIIRGRGGNKLTVSRLVS